MKRLAAFLVLLHLIAFPAATMAQEYASARLVSTTSWVEEWDPVSERWVRVADDGEEQAPRPAAVTTITTHIVNGVVVSETRETSGPQHRAARYARPVPYRAADAALASYGPFHVLDESRAVLVGSTGKHSPAQFDAMLRDHPGIEVLEMVDASGTTNDIANLAVGRRIRAAGLKTHVPNGGSVRSGAVELFLAGAEQTMEPGAQFAVHSWLDNHGREPDDFAPDAPENRLYLDYYVEMGMSESRARDFYAMTNSVPHAGALWLRAADMERWIAPEPRMAARQIRSAKLELLTVGSAPLPTPSLDVLGQANAIFAIVPVPEPAIGPVIRYDDIGTLTLAKAQLSGGGSS